MPKIKIKRKPVTIWVGLTPLAEFDTLCKVNQRSRREILELMTRRAFAEYTDDPDTRISP